VLRVDILDATDLKMKGYKHWKSMKPMIKKPIPVASRPCTPF
jgi:hypothetical protein